MDLLKEQLKSLYLESFEDSERFVDFFLDNYFNGGNVLYKKEGEEIISALYIIEKSLYLRGKVYDFPFLSAVSTRAHLRGKGLIQSVMYDAFAKLLQEKTPYCALYPFSHGYYKKYGYTVINGVECKKVQFCGEKCVVHKNPSASTLLAVYDCYAKGFDNYIIRDLPRFKQLLDDWEVSGKKVKLITCGEKSCYVSYGGGEIEECGGELSLLGAVTDIIGLEYVQFFGNEFYTMARIIDICAALDCGGFLCDGEFTFYLKDSFFPQNSGTYHLKVKNGKGKAEKISQDNICSREIPIEELTQVMLCGGKTCGFEVEQSGIFCLDKY